MELIEYDPMTKTAVWHDYDSQTDTTSIHTVQDVEPILEANKAEMADVAPGKEWRHSARIPNILIEKWLREEGIDVFNNDHWQAVVRKLNSNEYIYLRTSHGRLGGRIG